MVSQSDALILLLQALAAMRDAGYSDDDVVDLVKDAWDHLEGGGQRLMLSATAPNAAASSSVGQRTNGQSWSASPAHTAASPGDYHHPLVTDHT